MFGLEVRFWVGCLAYRWALGWGVWLRGALLGGVFGLEMGFGVGVFGLEVRFWGIWLIDGLWGGVFGLEALGWGCLA